MAGVFGAWSPRWGTEERWFQTKFSGTWGQCISWHLRSAVAALTPGLTQEGRCTPQTKLRQGFPFPGKLVQSYCHPLSSKASVHSGTRMENPSCSRQEIPQWRPLELHHCNKSHHPCKAGSVPVLFVFGLNVVIPYYACVYIREHLS